MNDFQPEKVSKKQEALSFKSNVSEGSLHDSESIFISDKWQYIFNSFKWDAPGKSKEWPFMVVLA